MARSATATINAVDGVCGPIEVERGHQVQARVKGSGGGWTAGKLALECSVDEGTVYHVASSDLFEKDVIELLAGKTEVGGKYRIRALADFTGEVTADITAAAG